jgi:hypothetical protein
LAGLGLGQKPKFFIQVFSCRPDRNVCRQFANNVSGEDIVKTIGIIDGIVGFPRMIYEICTLVT